MIAGTGVLRPDRKSRLKRGHRLARVCMLVLLCPVVNGCTAGDTDTLSIADLPVFEIEQDLRIDGHEDDLAPVQWLGVGPDGTIAVMQQLINGVRFFDSLGANKGVVGRDGEGPGEFRRPNYAGWNGDTLWVSDQGLMRITLVSAEPVFLGTLPPISPIRPAPEDETRFPTRPYIFVRALYPDGSILGFHPGADGFDGSPVFHVAGDGFIKSLMLEIPLDRNMFIEYGPGGGSTRAAVPFYPRTEWAVAPDGGRVGVLTIAFSGPEAETFRVTIYEAPSSREIFSRTYPYQGIPIPDHVVDSVLKARARAIAAAPPLPFGRTRPTLSRGEESELRSRVPPFYPPVREIKVGMDGRIWIRLFRQDKLEEWLVMSPEGDPQGRALLPSRTTLQAANATHLWALESDELDVESVVRYRLHVRDLP